MKKSTIQTLVKIVAVLLIAICVISFTNNVNAELLDPKNIQPDANVESGDALQLAQKAAGWIRNISVIAAVIIIMIIGVKYILGSVEEKAEYKKTFMPLIIGIILVVAATTIATFIFNAVDTNGEGEKEKQPASLNDKIVAVTLIDEKA